MFLSATPSIFTLLLKQLRTNSSDMQFINLSALALLATSALAADCFGLHHQGCTTRGSKSIKGLATITVNVELSRKNTGGKKGFKDCWDATENIINQCVKGSHQLSGTWEYNGQLYQVNGYYS
ncbi:uncharacterized protein BKA55DRAFT_735146 [Fusarium redolens]|uniref:Uncharacterized protein n=1 Tax=Fusarium redolens TaxID=48865 RepID=A0A9P9HNI5_FUSRE|nr:uncharacterized protein BKA55DRAFT_735146 [Fusarium redolens]KAH7260884.1 hypothetical protein BKA55DRAFT_735146 [Fusarium redolens]